MRRGFDFKSLRFSTFQHSRIHSVVLGAYSCLYNILFSAMKALMEARQGHTSSWLHLRVLSDASYEAQEVARKNASTLVPHKPRPKTTALVARRLVEGALGVRAPVSKEQRKVERQLLNDARGLILVIAVNNPADAMIYSYSICTRFNK